MARHDKELRSMSTGERIPNWIDIEGEEIVAEGIGSVVVREEEDGSWSIVRSVTGAAPDVDKGHASKEVAVRLAQAYNEGSSIAIEERVSRQIRKANIHPGMLAKYGENSVTITGVDGTEVKVMTPEGSEFYVDHSQLADIREAQDPSLDMVAVEPLPVEEVTDMGTGYEEYEEPEVEEVVDMNAGYEEPEVEEVVDMNAGYEEPEVEEVVDTEEIFDGELSEIMQLFQYLEEEEEELQGTEIGPPVVFVEIEPMPGERQAPLGASKIKYAGLVSLLKHGGLSVTAITNVQQVKLSDVLLVHRGNLPFEAYSLEGSPIPEELEDKQLSRDEVIAVLGVHYDISEDLAESLINRATRGYPTQVAHKRGIQIYAEGEEIFGDPVDIPDSSPIEITVPEDVEPSEARFGIRMEGISADGAPLFILTQDDQQISTAALPEIEFVQELVNLLPEVANDPNILTQQLQLAVEQGITPIIAVFRMGNCGKCSADKDKKDKDKKDKDKKDKDKKDKNAMVPVEIVAKVSSAIAEAMVANNVKGIRLARLEEIFLNAHKEVTAKECPKCKKDPCKCKKEKTAKEAPTCSKCNTKHWPFHKCNGGGKDKKDDDEAGSKDTKYGPDEKTGNMINQAVGEELAAVAYEGGGRYAVGEQSGLSYEQAVEALQTVAPNDDNRWRLDKYKERGEAESNLGEGMEPSLTGPASISDAGETNTNTSTPGEAPVTGGRVRMSFDWGEFFTDVIPQLANRQFQQVFESALITPQEEATISQAEKDIHDEEILLLAREAGTRKLPHPYDILHGLGVRVSIKADSEVTGEITEYRFAKDRTSIDYLVKVDEDNELWYSEPELLPVEGKDKNDKAKKDKEDKAKKDKAKKDKAKKDKEDKAKKDKEDKAKKDKAKKDKEKKKEAAKDLQPTSNPDTTLVPWTDRSKKIADPENVKQDSAYKQDLAQKTGQGSPDTVMRIGAFAKIKADYQPALAEVVTLRDKEIAGIVVELNDREAALKFTEGVLLIDTDKLEVVGNFFREAIIRKCKSGDKDPDRPAEEQEWCLYAKSTGKVLGRHSSEEEARNQEAAIKAQGAILIAELTPEYLAEALEDEEKGTQGYADKAEELPEGSSRKQLFQEMASDEAGHALHLKDLQLSLKDGVEPIGGTPGRGGDPDPKKKRKLSVPPEAPSKGTIGEDKNKGNIPQGHPDVFAPSQRKFACTIYTYADQLLTKVQEGTITSSEAKKELNVAAKEQGWNAAQKKYIKQRLEGKVAARSAKNVTDHITRDAASVTVPTNLTLRYQQEKEAYCLYDLDFGPISIDNAKEKDIKGQLQAFRLPDAQITEALKESKQGDVLIRIGMDINEAIVWAIDAVMSGTNTLSGTQLIAPAQAPRGILMKAAMEELSEILGEDVAASYQKPLKKALQERLESEPRQEYDGHREFPQHGLTIPANKVARTYDESETRERVNQFAKHGIPLDLIKTAPRPQPDEIVDTPPDRKLNAAASLRPFAFGDWVRDKLHPEFTGVILGYNGDSFVRVAMDQTSYCEAGSESLYLTDGLERIAQESEFEDIEKTKKKKYYPRQELKQDLFWNSPGDMP